LEHQLLMSKLLLHKDEVVTQNRKAVVEDLLVGPFWLRYHLVGMMEELLLVLRILLLELKRLLLEGELQSQSGVFDH
jgi:hypothetical protein